MARIDSRQAKHSKAWADHKNRGGLKSTQQFQDGAVGGALRIRDSTIGDVTLKDIQTFGQASIGAGGLSDTQSRKF